jgi:uncharacterized glyoxalase superfamily protein PhnB
MAEQRVFPMLSYEDVGRAADWIAKAFGFDERERFSDEDGTVTHVTMVLDEAVVFLGWPGRAIGARSGTPRNARSSAASWIRRTWLTASWSTSPM